MAKDDLEAIRERKRAELRETVDDTESTEPRSPSEPIHVESADHLAELLADHEVLLADFYADWCGPCQMLEPIIEELAAETDAAVVKIDIDAYQDLALDYAVRGVPTALLFKDGDLADRLVGVQDKDRYQRAISAQTP